MDKDNTFRIQNKVSKKLIGNIQNEKNLVFVCE